jgi:hypothetical protein
MAKLPIPQRGQPIDLSLMYDIINSINELYSTVSQRGSTYAKLATSMSGVSPVDLKVNNIKLVTGYTEISNQTIASNATLTFSAPFETAADFKTPPIISATLQANSSSAASAKNATVIITNVTTSRVEGQINFGTLSQSTQFSGAVHIIAIGQPM